MIRDFNTSLTALGGHKLEGYPDEQASGEEKFKRYQLAERISAAGPQDVSVEEVALIKRLIGKGYPPMVVGPAWLALENDPAPVEPNPA